MGTVTISGNDFTIYGTQGAAVIHHSASLGTDAAAFSAASGDNQAKSLVEATRMIDRMKWNSDAETHALRAALQRDWAGGDQFVFHLACYELAAMLLANPSLKNEAQSGSNVASVGAGPAQVSFFRPTLGITGPLPKIIHDLVGEYLAGRDSTGGEAFGTDAESSFDDTDAYSIERSF